MKFFKYSVLAFALAVGFTSCSEEDDYVPGQASPGVYFPTTDPLDVTLDREKTYFEVTVARSGVTEMMTYNIVGDADSDIFTLPTSVEFAQGASTATIAIDYNQEGMAPDKAYDVVLRFAEGITTSDYGFSSIEMSVVLPAPWKTIGTGTYRDLYLLALTSLSQEEDFNPTWECEIQQHEIDPTRFRWKAPYGKNFAKWCAANGVGELEDDEYDSKEQYSVEFLCDPKVGLVVVPIQSLGFQFFTDGVMYVMNEAGLYYPTNPYETICAAIPELCGEATFEEVDDPDNEGEKMLTVRTVFSGDKIALVSFTPNTAKYYGGSGYQWLREGVDIKDYNISIAYEGVLMLPNETERVMTTVKLGADVTSAKTGLVMTDDEEEALAAVENDEVNTQTIEKAEAALRFAFDGSGDYTVAVIAYNDKNEVVNTGTLTFFVADNSKPKDWKAVGEGEYYDRFCLPMYGLGDTNHWPVAIEQNQTDPTLYRWVHPYGSAFVAAVIELTGQGLAPQQYDSNDELYVQFRTQNGYTAVLPSYTGVMFSSADGYMTVMNAAGYNLDGGVDWDLIEANRPEFFGTATLNGDKIVQIEEGETNSLVSFELDEGPYNWRGDVGGLQWVAGSAAAAPAKAPSLKAAQSLTNALKVRNDVLLKVDPRTFCGKPYVKK